MSTSRVCAGLCLKTSATAFGQNVVLSPLRPLGPEAFAAVQTFFAYDTGIPLNARAAVDMESATWRRQKIVFTGVDGNRVPGLLTVPLGRQPPFPVVLEIHAGASSKEDWWREDSFERGRLVTDRLLAAGVAVLSLDTQFHGERAAASDFESFRTMWFDKQWFKWIRDGMLQTTKDYRRALDYLASRPDIDMRRAGVIGYSLGGMIALYLAAFEPRIRVSVACVAGITEPWLYPIAPINVANGLQRLPLLLLAGRTDNLASESNMNALFSALPGSQKHFGFFESGHRLPAAYADSATSWLRSRLR